jgi:hypothetical protein
MSGLSSVARAEAVRVASPSGRSFFILRGRSPWLSRALWLNQGMFARKLRVEYQHEGQLQPCPLKWLDSFSMRSFTNASVFDDTLPVADGCLEIGANVPLDQLRDAMEDWFRRKSYLPKDATLVLTLS